MKAIVLKDFRDKYTDALYKEGSTIEVTEERFEEIQKTGSLLAKVDETEIVKKKRTEKPLGDSQGRTDKKEKK